MKRRCVLLHDLVIIALLILGQGQGIAWADTLEMIDGAQLNGVILKRNPHFILFKTDKTYNERKLRFYFHNIMKINGQVPIENMMSTGSREEIETNDKFVTTAIQDMSTAAEKFALAHQGAYPTNFEAMREADPNFRLPNQCGREKAGYRFYCQFSVSGYQITVVPIQLDVTGSRSWSISTHGVNDIE